MEATVSESVPGRGLERAKSQRDSGGDDERCRSEDVVQLHDVVLAGDDERVLPQEFVVVWQH